MIEEMHEEMAEEQGPHKCEDILKDFIPRIDTSSPGKLQKLHSELKETGIFDQQKKRVYWVDEERRNCFMLYAQALTIIWGGAPRSWRWYPVKITSTDVSVNVAELLDVCWLEVYGDFKTEYLTPNTEYEVSYVIMLKDPSYGWEDEVEFRLTLPQTSDQPQIHKRDMSKLQKGKWKYIQAGKFTPSPGQSGLMNFRLRQNFNKWKRGLHILGVYILPTN